MSLVRDDDTKNVLVDVINDVIFKFRRLNSGFYFTKYRSNFKWGVLACAKQTRKIKELKKLVTTGYNWFCFKLIDVNMEH